MPRSDLERLAEAIHVLAGQVERDVPLLQERQRHIAQLAARTARLAGPGDSALVRVVQLARLAAERLTDAIEHLTATADSGRAYAETLAGRSGGGRRAGATETTTVAGSAQPGSRTSSRRLEEIRRHLMNEGDDMGQALANVAEPVVGPPSEIRTDGVDNPVSAVIIVLTLGWESAVRMLKRRRRRRD